MLKIHQVLFPDPAVRKKMEAEKEEGFFPQRSASVRIRDSSLVPLSSALFPFVYRDIPDCIFTISSTGSEKKLDSCRATVPPKWSVPATR